mmetsp:Transcript_50232/g.78522  ORF Transcript_50232/g.78522 Transcript_50232/m.78522 type:complete len:150 (-) Transcript_50232:440-889(-)
MKKPNCRKARITEARLAKKDTHVTPVVAKDARPALRYVHIRRSLGSLLIAPDSCQKSVYTKIISAPKPTRRKTAKNDVKFTLRVSVNMLVTMYAKGTASNAIDIAAKVKAKLRVWKIRYNMTNAAEAIARSMSLCKVSFKIKSEISVPS